MTSEGVFTFQINSDDDEDFHQQPTQQTTSPNKNLSQPTTFSLNLNNINGTNGSNNLNVSQSPKPTSFTIPENGRNSNNNNNNNNNNENNSNNNNENKKDNNNNYNDKANGNDLNNKNGIDKINGNGNGNVNGNVNGNGNGNVNGRSYTPQSRSSTSTPTSISLSKFYPQSLKSPQNDFSVLQNNNAFLRFPEVTNNNSEKTEKRNSPFLLTNKSEQQTKQNNSAFHIPTKLLSTPTPTTTTTITTNESIKYNPNITQQQQQQQQRPKLKDILQQQLKGIDNDEQQQQKQQEEEKYNFNLKQSQRAESISGSFEIDNQRDYDAYQLLQQQLQQQQRQEEQQQQQQVPFLPFYQQDQQDQKQDDKKSQIKWKGQGHSSNRGWTDRPDLTTEQKLKNKIYEKDREIKEKDDIILDLKRQLIDANNELRILRSSNHSNDYGNFPILFSDNIQPFSDNNNLQSQQSSIEHSKLKEKAQKLEMKNEELSRLVDSLKQTLSKNVQNQAITGNLILPEISGGDNPNFQADHQFASQMGQIRDSIQISYEQRLLREQENREKIDNLVLQKQKREAEWAIIQSRFNEEILSREAKVANETRKKYEEIHQQIVNQFEQEQIKAKNLHLNELELSKNEIKEIQHQMSELRKKYRNEINEIEDKSNDYKKQMKELEVNFLSQQESLQYFEAESESAKRIIEEMQKLEGEKENELLKEKSKTEKISLNLHKISEENDKLKKQINSLNDQRNQEFSTLSEQLNDKIGEIERIMKENFEKENRIDHLQREIERLMRVHERELKEASLSKEKEAELRLIFEREKNQIIEELNSKSVELENVLTKEEANKSLIQNFQNRIKELENDLSNLTQKFKKVSSNTQEIQLLQNTVNEKNILIQDQSNQIQQLTAQLSEIKNISHSQIQSIETDRQASKAQLEEMLQLVSHLQLEAKKFDLIRRKMHNAIQELKGNIRVFVRIKPLPVSNGNMGNITPIQVLNELTDEGQQQLSVVITPEMSNRKQTFSGREQKFPFRFDRIFLGSDQEEVFEEISQLVQSALDGYRVCIFAYGQTGSGKTYTMEGEGHRDKSLAGIIPRSVEKMFFWTQELTKTKGWQFQIGCSFVEIYNDELRDLLANNRNEEKLQIKSGDGPISVPGLQIINVQSASQVFKLLEVAHGNRATATTKMNERSSRSHSVFQLYISGICASSNETIDGKLNLIDLAGSERLDKSESTGDRLTEAKSINKSLHALADVISSIANKEPHVPYRNSKLTHLLQDSLGGDCKMLMFANVSGEVFNVQETLCSLRFAHKVNKTNIGVAKSSAKVNLSSTLEGQDDE